MSLKNHPLYAILSGIRQRCMYPSYAQYKDYGGRGIKLYAEWHNDPWKFFSYVEQYLGSRPAGNTIDRIDNNGDYCPGNIQWATFAHQQRNKRNNRRVTINGETKCLSEWAEQLGVSVQTLHSRIARGWNEEDILKPSRTKSIVRITVNQETHSISEWSRISGVSKTEIKRRLDKGITGADLLSPTRRTK